MFSFRETFQLQKINKRSYGKNLGFFHVEHSKTAFLMRNLSIDTRNLSIFSDKQGHSFQFPEKSRGPPPPPWPGSQEKQIW